MPQLGKSDKYGNDPDMTDHDAIAALDRSGAVEPEPAARMPSGFHHGRGAVTNPAVRFSSSVVSPFDDGWDTLTGEIEEPVKLATTLIKDATKSVIAWNSSPDLGFDRAVNPYRGCEHGCVYCYARPPTPISAIPRDLISKPN